MPEPCFAEREERFKPVIASIASGNDNIEDMFLVDYQEPGGPNILFQEPRTICISTALVNQDKSNAQLPWFSEKENSVIQSDLVANEEEQIQELIFQTKRLGLVRYKNKLADMLLSLFNDAKEEDPDSIGISLRSLQNFRNFLISNTNLRCPTISLTPDHNIYASWRSEQNRVFSIHFLPSGEARFVILKPNPRHPERKTRISGVATIDILMETIMPNHIEEWILE